MNEVFETLIKGIFDRNLNVDNWKEAYKVAESTSAKLINSLGEYLAMGYELDDEFCKGTLNDILTRAYLQGRDLGMSAQSAMNKRMDIALQIQEGHSGGSIETAVKKALDSEFRYPSITRSIREMGTRAVSDTAKVNAKFQNDAGFGIWIERINDNKGLMGNRRCWYCDQYAGTYYYPDIPDECWGFHDGCGCKLIYHNDKKKKIEYIH